MVIVLRKTRSYSKTLRKLYFKGKTSLKHHRKGKYYELVSCHDVITDFVFTHSCGPTKLLKKKSLNLVQKTSLVLTKYVSQKVIKAI